MGVATRGLFKKAHFLIYRCPFETTILFARFKVQSVRLQRERPMCQQISASKMVARRENFELVAKWPIARHWQL